MPDLRLDTGALLTTATTLDQVAGALSSTDRSADVAAEAVGHRGLAAAVQDFSRSSERQRHELARSTSDHAKRVRDAAATFDAVEAALAATLDGEG